MLNAAIFELIRLGIKVTFEGSDKFLWIRAWGPLPYSNAYWQMESTWPWQEIQKVNFDIVALKLGEIRNLYLAEISRLTAAQEAVTREL